MICGERTVQCRSQNTALSRCSKSLLSGGLDYEGATMEWLCVTVATQNVAY